MPVDTQQILDHWKSAEALAREAERELTAAWQRYEQTRQDPPGQDLIQEVARRRKVAGERLADVVRVLGPKPSRT
jgi:predicted metal-dependent hydrolase